jgi:endonuclease/exonuclease/phosphatase (EEP) superfamily protein YafD
VIPPLIAIDHVLHGPGLRGVGADERSIPGSDHRMVIAELLITPR